MPLLPALHPRSIFSGRLPILINSSPCLYIGTNIDLAGVRLFSLPSSKTHFWYVVETVRPLPTVPLHALGSPAFMAFMSVSGS